MPSHARRSGPKPSFDPPMKAEDEEKVDFNLWKAGIPELQVIPPVVRYASGMVRAMTPREAHDLYKKDRGEERYREFLEDFNKKKEMKPQPKKRPRFPDDEDPAPKAQR